MSVNPAAIRDAEEVLRGALGERLRSDFPLAPLTSFRLGGPAALYLEIESSSDLEEVARAVIETGVPFVQKPFAPTALAAGVVLGGLLLVTATVLVVADACTAA